MSWEHIRRAPIWIGFWFGILGVYPLFCPWHDSQDKACGLVLCGLVTGIVARATTDASRDRTDRWLLLLVALFVISCIGTYCIRML
ncbi:MAG: hypothetical protein JXA67_01140 [Micromonosporaceae bacterium]|nr:hypothetical protein [Micromonosporaceae bacterium]